jgi:DNA-binding NarL/FixJ family response regulator
VFIAISKAKYFHHSVEKMQHLTCKHFTAIDEVYNVLSPKFETILFLHLEDESKVIHSICYDLLLLTPRLKIVLFRNNTNVLEGCSLLKLGVKGYAHAMSHSEMMQHIYQTVEQQNVWVYPELMQFMIAEVSAKQIPDLKKLDTLSPKEKEIALMTADGLSNAKVATLLNLAEITIKKHLTNIYEKLNVKDRLGLALFIKHSQS